MDTIDKPVSAKWHIILALGVFLILLSLYSLWIAYSQIQVTTAIDSSPYELRFKDMPSDTRIAYYIQSTHYKISGSQLYAGGTTHLNEVMAGEFKLRRQGQILFVNDQLLQAGERYDVVRHNPSYNPWMRFTTRIVIVNNGLNLPVSSTSGSNALYVNGSISEHWQGSPFGLIIIVSGIVLVMLGNWGTKRTNIARGQYVMDPSIPQKIKAGGIATGFFGWVIFSNLFYSSLDTTFVSESPMGLNVNLFITWLPAIIASLVLYRMKRFSICTGVVLAVAVNAGIWMYLSMESINTFSEFFEWLLIFGIPFPTPFFTILAFGW